MSAAHLASRTLLLCRSMEYTQSYRLKDHLYNSIHEKEALHRGREQGFIEDGNVYKAADTNDDGSCALHAIWGVPTIHPRDRARLWYSCKDARLELRKIMDDGLRNDKAPPFEQSLKEMLLHTVREQVCIAIGILSGNSEDNDTEAHIVWEALSQHCKESLIQFAKKKGRNMKSRRKSSDASKLHYVRCLIRCWIVYVPH